jgi:hypothetical protein
VLRTLLLALALLGAGAGPALAAGSLGLAVQSRVYIDEGRALLVENRGDVAAVVRLVASGGWAVEPASLTLAPGELGEASVRGEGADGATITIIATSADPVLAGEARSVVELTATVHHERPFDLSPWLAGLLLAGVAAAVGAHAWRRARR